MIARVNSPLVRLSGGGRFAGRRTTVKNTGRFITAISTLGRSHRKLFTLRDAAIFITQLPKAEHDAEPWQAAMEVLLLVAERDGPTMLARIGVMLGIEPER